MKDRGVTMNLYFRSALVAALMSVASSANAATVTVPGGGNIQSYVNANPAGTTYDLQPGTYSGQTITPKSGDTFIGHPGTVLNGGGGGSEKHAFTVGSGVVNVTIDGLAIRNYVDNPDPNLTRGVFQNTPSNTGWVVRNCDIGPNVGVGVKAISGITISNNKIHDNTWLGITGYTGSSNILIDNNDIYNNNTDHMSLYGPTGFASGIKLYNIKNITLSNNKIHGNYGAGIWFDTNWSGVTIDSNEIFGQLRDTAHSGAAGLGIFMEIGLAGCSGTTSRISNNYIHDEDVGMLLSTSGCMDIFGNAFSANRIATIRAFQEPRGIGSNGVKWRQEHNHIHNNWLAYSQGIVSQRDTGSGFLWYNQDNTYTQNTYYIPCGSGDFAYQGERYLNSNGTLRSRTSWNGLPSAPDSTSTFHCGVTSLPAGVGPRGGYIAPGQPGQTPYGGSARAIPGTIQAEDFDVGGEGVAYHDTDTVNNGGAYRPGGVDIKNSSGSPASPAIGWVKSGEWWEYTVNVTTTGTYRLEARVASAYTGKSLHVEIDGVNKTGTMVVPNTGPWNTAWATITKTGVSLTAGKHVMRVYADTDLFDLNFVKFVVSP